MRPRLRAAAALALLTLAAGAGAHDAPVAAPVPSWPGPGPAPAAGPWRGVAIGMYPWEAKARGFPFPPDLGEVARLGATHVLLTVAWEQEGVTGVVLRPGPHTVADELLEEVVRRAHAARLGVVLVPVVDIVGGGPGDWRGVLRPAEPRTWWRSYRRFILHYARLAARAHVTMFAIGSELTSMSGDDAAAEWRRLAAAARRGYGGLLVFGVNHDALDRLAPAAFVDVVGVSAYFPLARAPGASATALRSAWRSAAARLRRVAVDSGKPVVILEVGYPSVVGGAVAPWDYTGGAPVDLEEQRAAYAAAVDALLASPWVDGALFWTWFGPGGPHDRYYTPRGKPAERELRRYLAAPRPRNAWPRAETLSRETLVGRDGPATPRPPWRLR